MTDKQPILPHERVALEDQLIELVEESYRTSEELAIARELDPETWSGHQGEVKAVNDHADVLAGRGMRLIRQIDASHVVPYPDPLEPSVLLGSLVKVGHAPKDSAQKTEYFELCGLRTASTQNYAVAVTAGSILGRRLIGSQVGDTIQTDDSGENTVGIIDISQIAVQQAVVLDSLRYEHTTGRIYPPIKRYSDTSSSALGQEQFAPEAIIGIAPSKIDVALPLPKTVFDEVLQILGIREGGFKRIPNRIILRKFEDIVSPYITLENISPGSTVLGALSALPSELRHRSGMITTRVMDTSGLESRLSDMFTSSVKRLGLDVDTQAVSGEDPMVFIITCPESNDRTLVEIEGISHSVNFSERTRLLGKKTLLLADAYELQSGETAKTVEALIIQSKRNEGTALMLGSRDIIDVRLRRLISNLINEGRIRVICGNESEFQKLVLGYISTDVDTTEVIERLQLTNAVPHVLMTKGDEGTVAWSNNRRFHQEAIQVHPQQTISTSGAGDVMAGAFVAGLVLEQNVEDSLLRGAQLASKIIQSKSDLLIE